jgi:hypothetical protein
MKILSWTIRIFKYEPESGKFVSGSGNNIQNKDTLETKFSAGATPNEKTTIYQYTKQQRFYD